MKASIGLLTEDELKSLLEACKDGATVDLTYTLSESDLLAALGALHVARQNAERAALEARQAQAKRTAELKTWAEGEVKRHLDAYKASLEPHMRAWAEGYKANVEASATAWVQQAAKLAAAGQIALTPIQVIVEHPAASVQRTEVLRDEAGNMAGSKSETRYIVARTEPPLSQG